MPANNCPHCGAAVTGLICEYCGSITEIQGDPDKQKEALDIYHRLLRKASNEHQVRLLKTGFLPDSSALLVEAGLTTLNFMDTNDVMLSRKDAAAKRLEVIIMKLQLLPKDAATWNTIAIFQDKLDNYKKSEKMSILYGFILISSVIAVIVFIA